MGYGLCGPMGYGQHFPANQLGGWLKVWGKRGYGLRQVWVKRGLTVVVWKDLSAAGQSAAVSRTHYH
jgi:hypothetical protein